SAKNDLFQVCVTVLREGIETDDTENPYVGSNCTTIRGGIVSCKVEFLALEPPVRDTIGCTNIVDSSLSIHNDDINSSSLKFG
ncbi:hypothetical protein Tco_1374291, partial [Tanacetum coccineum]